MWNDFVFESPKKLKKVIPTEDWTHEASGGELPEAIDDPMEELNQLVLSKANYNGEEQGLYHPLHHQQIKLRNNEMMDIFVDKDNGWRLDPHTQSINLFTNDYKQHIGNQTSWMTGFKREHIHGVDLAKIHGEYWRHVYGDIGFVGEKNWRQEVKGNQHNLVYKNDNLTVDGNQKTNIGGSQNITIDGNLTIKVKGTIDMRAGGRVIIDGSRVDVGL